MSALGSEVDLEVAVVYRPVKGPAVLLTTVMDDELVRLVSDIAIARGYARADHLSKEDLVLAAIERGETEQLSRTLRLLLPQLPEQAETTSA